MPHRRPSKAPRPWDPDAIRGGAWLLVVGLLLSVLAHGVIPFAGSFWRPPAVSRVAIVEFTPTPLPFDEQPADGPDLQDAPLPEPDADDPSPDAPLTQPPPEPVVAPDDDTAPPEPQAAPSAPATDDGALAAQQERERRRQEWLAERERRRAEREAKRAERRAAAEAARKGGAKEGGEIIGDPEAVYLCTPTERGPKLEVRTERPISSWITILPSVFNHFSTRPALGSYLGDAKLVAVQKKRIGALDFAAPAKVLQMDLEQPRGVRLAVGRLDVRCMIGLSFQRKLFPLVLKRLPMRIVDAQGNSVALLANLTIYKDASIELVPWDSKQAPLPFTQGRLKNSKAIAKNIEDHFQAARLASSLAELFGFKPQQRSPSPRRSGPTNQAKR